MNTLRSTSPPLLVLMTPRSSASVHYRVYAQPLQTGAVLEWILSRLLALIPAGGRIVCVCDTDGERSALAKAAGRYRDEIAFESFPGQTEIELCRSVMTRFEVDRVLVTGFSRAAAPRQSLRDLYQLHVACRAELTEAVGGTFSDICYVVNAALVERLLTTKLPTRALTTLGGAQLLRKLAVARGATDIDFLWIRSDLNQRYGLLPARWPEEIRVDSDRDVEILRLMLASDGRDDPSRDLEIIDRWKNAATQISRQRMTPRIASDSRSPRRRRERRIRVLYASHMSSFTGAQQSLCHMISALDTSRYEASALISFEGAFAEQLRQRGVRVICPNHSIMKNSPENIALIRELIGAWKPDVVHANHLIGVPLIAAAMTTGLPLVQHVRIPDARLLRDHIVAADAVITVSEFIRQCVAVLDVDLDKVHVIWNGVRSDEYFPAPAEKLPSRTRLGIPTDAFVIALIARMARSKRHDSVLLALSQLRRATGRGHLLMVGDNESDLSYLQEIEALIQREGLAPFITRIQFVPDIRPVLHASDVLVLPSENEPLGRAVLEGMAVGLPVVVGESGGSKEVIDVGTTGFVVPSGGADQLSRVLSDLVVNPDLARKIGDAAAQKVQRSLTANVCAAKTAALYERLVAGRSAAMNGPGACRSIGAN